MCQLTIQCDNNADEFEVDKEEAKRITIFKRTGVRAVFKDDTRTEVERFYNVGDVDDFFGPLLANEKAYEDGLAAFHNRLTTAIT